MLRGVTPPEVPALAETLVGAGFRMLEVTLNSPRPFDSIAALVRACPAQFLWAYNRYKRPAGAPPPPEAAA